MFFLIISGILMIVGFTKLQDYLHQGADEDPYCTNIADWYLRGNYKRLKTVLPKVTLRTVCAAMSANASSIPTNASSTLLAELLSDPRVVFGRHSGYVYINMSIEYNIAPSSASEFSAELPHQLKNVSVNPVDFATTKIAEKISFSEILERNTTRKYVRLEQLGVLRETENKKGLYVWLESQRYVMYPQKSRSAAEALYKRMRDMSEIDPKLICVLGTLTAGKYEPKKMYNIMYRDPGIDIHVSDSENNTVKSMMLRRIILQYVYGLYKSGRLHKDLYLCYHDKLYIKHKTFCVCDNPDISELQNIIDTTDAETLNDTKEYLQTISIPVTYRERFCEVISLL
jgi:hypothetical protein